MNTKQCHLCKEVKNLSEFHIQSRSKDGRQPRCKPCACRITKEWADSNKDRVSRTHKDYYQKNKQASLEKGKLWRLKNWSSMLALGKKYRDNNPQKEIARARRYREAHKVEALEYRRQYREKNRGVVNFWDATRSAAEKKATPQWADKQKMREFYVNSNELTAGLEMRHHVDHIVPIQSKLVCGLHVEHNLRVIPASENVKKSNRFWPDMW